LTRRSALRCDLDHFKTLNDTHGHAYGDLALQQVATVLLASLRGTDRAFRYGGEELVVVSPETTAAEAVLVAERIRVALESAHEVGGPKVTASFGVAELGVHGSDASSLLAAADHALRRAKDAGRNQVLTATTAA